MLQVSHFMRSANIKMLTSADYLHFVHFFSLLLKKSKKRCKNWFDRSVTGQ